MKASWFFGANRAGEADVRPGNRRHLRRPPDADGTINHNSGAESTIHGLLTMLALDAHPAVAAQATAWPQTPERAGLTTVEAETADPTTGTVVTPMTPWTGESQYGGQALVLDRGDRASFAIGSSAWPRLIEPVSWLDERGDARSAWRQHDQPLGVLRHRVGAQGVSAVPGALLPQDLARPASPSDGEVSVRVTAGRVTLDALLVRPRISTFTRTGTGGRTQLVHSAAKDGDGSDGGLCR